MRNLTSLTSNIKKAVVCLGLLALISFPLDAQKNDKGNYYCVSNRGRKSDSHYLNKDKDKNPCSYKPAKIHKAFFYGTGGGESEIYCVPSQERKYKKHLHKEMKRE
jgi:hypothetical protein